MRVDLRLFAFVAGALAPALFAMPALAQDSDSFSVKAAIPFPANAFNSGGKVTSFDISYVDPRLGLYVLGDRSSRAVDLVHVHSNSITQLGVGAFKGVATSCASGNNNDCSGPDGVQIVEGREVWVGDGDSTFKIIDIASDTITATINTGGHFRVDEMCLDPRHEIVAVTNNADSPPFTTFYSTDGTHAKLGQTQWTTSTNGAEQCEWSPRTGKFYVAIPEVGGVQGAVAVVDPTNLSAAPTFFSIPLASCKNPQGMALGPDHQILLGCNGASGDGLHSTVVIDERDGHVIKTINNQSGADMVWFNPGNNHYFLARSSAFGGTQKLGIIDAESLVSDTDISVGPVTAPPANVHPNAHSVAADPVTNKTFFPVPGGLSTLCSSAGGNDALGCIAVLKGKTDRDDCVAEGSPVIRVSEDGDAEFHRGKCRDHDDHDH
jgi:hypothetical protein